MDEEYTFDVAAAEALGRIDELEAALAQAIETLRVYDLTATADKCERALKGSDLDS